MPLPRPNQVFNGTAACLIITCLLLTVSSILEPFKISFTTLVDTFDNTPYCCLVPTSDVLKLAALLLFEVADVPVYDHQTDHGPWVCMRYLASSILCRPRRLSFPTFASRCWKEESVREEKTQTQEE
jgi:hypothetical protein